MSSNNLINKVYEHNYTRMNSCLLLYPNSVDALVQDVRIPNISDSIFGDYTKWCYSLRYYPFNAIHQEATGKKLHYGQTTSQCLCEEITRYNTEGYYLGQYFYNAKYNDFRDYEPYSSCKIYLPFYGYTDINIFDVIGKYMQFRLYVDFITGQAVYVIGVNDNSVNCPTPPFLGYVNDSRTRILSKITFNIGYDLPVTSSGMADMIRNVLMNGIQVAASVGAYAVSPTLGAVTTAVKTTSGITKTVTKQTRNKNSGRLNISSRQTNIDSGNTTVTTKSTDFSGVVKRGFINELFGKSADLINSIHMSPSTSVSGNSSLELFSPRSIIIVRSSAQYINRGTEFNHIYGRPFGEVVKVSEMSGYSEFDITHNDVYEGNILSEEKDMIHELLSAGVYLPKRQMYAILEPNNIYISNFGSFATDIIVNGEYYDGIYFEEVQDSGGQTEAGLIKDYAYITIYNSANGLNKDFGSGTVLTFLDELSSEEIFLITQLCKRI